MRTVLIDGHNITAATRTFELKPRAGAGTNIRRLLHMLAAGGCTVTVLHTGDDEAHPPLGAPPQLTVDQLQDVTGSCLNLNTAGPPTAASWVDTNATLDLSHLTGRVFVRLVTADAVNDVRLVVDEGPGTPPVGASAALPVGAATEARQTSDHCTSVAAKTAPATPAAAEAIVGAATACHTGVLVCASESNGNLVYIGGTGVTTATGIALSAGDTLFLPVTDAALVFCVGGAAAQVVKAVVL